MKKRIRGFSGTLNPHPSERELKNREIARRAAAQSIVLLKNDGVLPLSKGTKVALLGTGACHMVKGGTGSGDVNEREVVSIVDGLTNAGLEITSRSWIEEYDHLYSTSRLAWRDMLRKELNGSQDFSIYVKNPFKAPEGRAVTAEDFGGASVGIYIISRIAGEGADRKLTPGDYELSVQEQEALQVMASCSENLIVVLNVGGQIDLKPVLSIPQVKGIVLLGQPGMEGGNALADVLTGAVNPCGKLAATWTENYSDFPNAATFSYCNGDISKEHYVEGIYVGYRYFDAFGVKPLFPFGFGLSYSTFSIVSKGISVSNDRVTVQVQVTNTGKYAGKEIVQVYAYCPQKNLRKELRRLCGFAKTDVLQPGQMQEVAVCFDAKDIASFDEMQSAWVLDQGQYGIFTGSSSASLTAAGVLDVPALTPIESVEHICPLLDPLKEIAAPNVLETAWMEETKDFIPVLFMPEKQSRAHRSPDKYECLAAEQVEQLSDEELIAVVAGGVTPGLDIAIGASGIMVPGAAGETTSALDEKWGIPPIEVADGPAGLRLWNSYEVDRAAGIVYNKGVWGALEGGILCDEGNHEGADTYYQYCTAMPVGSLLAQSWDIKLLEDVGRAVGIEMQEFGIALWLAPGMNIQRNPLCGRNYEYYSEDPLVTGTMAAAITRGVQSCKGVGTTIKHFACNNQEDNRLYSDSVVSERALREIYLRGFEIAVKHAQPMSIMTSYNLINGIRTANSFDLCTTVARNEWDFQGLIMTDWGTTTIGGSDAWKCAPVGNDLIMPGVEADITNIRQALSNGNLDRNDLKDSVRRILRVLYQTLAFEDD